MVLKRAVADTKGAIVDTGRTDSERAIMKSINNKFTNAAREQSDKLFAASLVILKLSCLEREKRGGVQAATGHEALATAMMALESYKETLEAAQGELKQGDLAQEKLEAERDAAKKYIAKVLEEAKQDDPQALGASTSGNRGYAESAALLMAKGIYELE